MPPTPSAPSRFVFDKTRFPILAELEAAFPIFLEEMQALSRDEYVLWPDTDAYLGEWWLFILFYNSYPDSLVVDFEANQRRCPRSMEFFAKHPSIFAAGFSWMEPGCHIVPHVDLKPDTQLRAHLALRIPDGAGFRVGDERHTWRDGEALVFEGLIDHETANFGSEPRILMMVDFTLTEEELAYSREFMSKVDPKFLASGGGRTM
ncbi:MAG: aspartyl/asparaginyl beta-hydroxylase domain-containing protein [Planctomycetota bacterium]